MVATISAGGASSVAAWAVHSACERYQGTDPLLTARSRRALAKDLGFPDDSAGIPDARWMRAMTFERLCHDAAFAGEVTTRATGWSGFSRPTAVVMADCGVSTTATLAQVRAAIARTADGTATLLFKLAVPYPGFPDGDATSVLPDLAVVARGDAGPTLIVGDVKDYERVRSHIDDGRLLKGFLQVAMGAFAFQQWDALPGGITVSRHGFLAVPRSAFLQPTVEVEDIGDHLAEVEAQWRARMDAQGAPALAEADRLPVYVRNLVACFDPSSCPSCSLVGYCRAQLRAARDPEALLVEIGVPEQERPSVLPVLTGGASSPAAKPTTAARVRATVTGRAQFTGQLRLDPVGRPGVINVVVAKSDAAALGVYGVGVCRETPDGASPWEYQVFNDPQSDETRRKVMTAIGRAIEVAIRDTTHDAGTHQPDPVHVVVPDAATADLLASLADLLAGIELSRLRWQRDKQAGRPILTYNGEPATMPKALEGPRRTAVSFLLEHDRARMLAVREPVLDLTRVMARYVVPGGAAVEAGRLDYVVAWATADDPVDHRVVSDAVAVGPHTPGARLANETSNAIHAALGAARTTGDLTGYETLVMEELEYKAASLDAAVDVLDGIPDSRLQPAYRTLEGDAQTIWRRRARLRASDLVRFGRTYRHWRNQLVDVISADTLCAAQVAALANPLAAAERARDAGNRDVTWATVVATSPLTLDIDSRRLAAGDTVVLLASGDQPWLESSGVQVSPQKGAIRLTGFPQGRLDDQAGTIDPLPRGRFVWTPSVPPLLAVGDRVVLARADWFGYTTHPVAIKIGRPAPDDQAAPKAGCTADSYAQDSVTHRWCCKPHDLVEADFADDIALRRARNQLNPEVWPPVRDADGFEVAPSGKPTSRDVTVPDSKAPQGVSVDDLD